MDLNQLRENTHELRRLLATKVLGQTQVIDLVVITVLCGGHALLTGAPGVAKTTLVRSLAQALGCGYKRIQFTPDLTPFDILGGDTIQFDEKNPDVKRIAFVPGPIFAPFVLADEINRASPRTQSALLEAMQERQVSLGGQSRPLPRPFFVFATQNPIENEGTFPLPEAQLDRFLFNIDVGYPGFETELQIATMPGIDKELPALSGAALVVNARQSMEQFPMSQQLVEACVRLVRNTRPEETSLQHIKNFVEFGSSPRASQALVLAAKAAAFLSGASQVGWEHVERVAPAVLQHRLVLNFKAASEGIKSLDVCKTLVAESIL
jgi:MoxR-like ATPase